MTAAIRLDPDQIAGPIDAAAPASTLLSIESLFV
jgi:hypothetical protein